MRTDGGTGVLHTIRREQQGKKHDIKQRVDVSVGNVMPANGSTTHSPSGETWGSCAEPAFGSGQHFCQ